MQKGSEICNHVIICKFNYKLKQLETVTQHSVMKDKCSKVKVIYKKTPVEVET